MSLGARELFASSDWSRSPIGAIEAWPARLRVLAQLVLADRYPTIVMWGRDLIAVAFNDAYIDLVGSGLCPALGARLAPWPHVGSGEGPMLDAVFDDGRSLHFEDILYPLDRDGCSQEVYLTISYDPVRDDGERIIGVRATMIESTRNVLDERRLRSLRELASRTARIRSLPEIGEIGARVAARNAGDVVFALVFGAADRANHSAGVPEAALLGCVGLDKIDARELGTFAVAIAGAGGSALVELGSWRQREPSAGRALGDPVQTAFIAALADSSGRGVLGWIVLGLSPALPLDARYREYLDLIAMQFAVAFENATVFGREHRIADTLQRAALPGTLPAIPGLLIGAVYEAGSDEARIGGDWYDAFELADGRVAISIGDVAGSGVVAAAAMGAARQMIRALAQTLQNPIDILNAVDRAFRSEHMDLIVTAFVGFLQPDHRSLSYASAGHPPPFMRHADGEIQALSAPDLPIGLRTGESAEPSRAALTDRSVIVLYTDGLIEATRDPIEGQARLERAMRSGAFAGNARKAAYLYAAVLEHRANDDVALLVIELARSPHEDRAAQLSNDERLRTPAQSGFRKKGDEVPQMAKGKEPKKEKKKPKKDAKPKAK